MIIRYRIFWNDSSDVLGLSAECNDRHLKGSIEHESEQYPQISEKHVTENAVKYGKINCNYRSGDTSLACSSSMYPIKDLTGQEIYVFFSDLAEDNWQKLWTGTGLRNLIDSVNICNYKDFTRSFITLETF